MRVQVMNMATREWTDVADAKWLRVVTDAGTFEINGTDRMLPADYVSLRAIGDGRLEISPVASNTVGIRAGETD